MSVNYQTGTATDANDLLSQLATFAAAHGWTVQQPSIHPVNQNVGYVYSNGSVFAAINSDLTTSPANITVGGCESFNGSANWNAQPNQTPTLKTANVGLGPFPNYYFFVGDELGHPYIQIAIEVIAGVYRHIFIGELVKFGAYTGGTYCGATRHNTTTGSIDVASDQTHNWIADAATNLSLGGTDHVRCDADGNTNNWALLAPVSTFTANKACGSVRAGGFTWNSYNAAEAKYNSRMPLDPITIFYNRAASLRSPIGRLPNMRHVNLSLFAPATTYVIGGDTWMVFPIIARTDADGTITGTFYSSRYHGYAYRR